MHAGELLIFNGVGRLASREDRNGNTTTVGYDSSGRMTSITGTAGPVGARTVSVSFDASTGLLTGYTRMMATRSVSVSYGYDAQRNLTSITDADGEITTFAYADPDRHDITGITTPAGREIDITWDGSHRVTSFTQVADLGTRQGATTRLFYGRERNRVASPTTDLSLPVTSVPNTGYTFDVNVRATEVIDPSGAVRSATYTPFFDVATATNAVAGVSTNTHGANGGESLTSTQASTGATSTLAYGATATATNPTAAYQPTGGADARGNTSAYSYDGAGNPTSATNAMAAESRLAHNTDGTVATSTAPTGIGAGPGGADASTSYGYHPDLDQVTTITAPAGSSLGVVQLSYDDAGRVERRESGTGDYTSYLYDNLDRVTYQGTGGYDVRVKYIYDGDGNVLTREHNGAVTTYTRDSANRLTHIARPSGVNTSYSYDAAGNLTALSDGRGTTRYTYDARNLLTTMTLDTGAVDQISVFDYDADARRVDTWHNASSTTTPPSGWAVHQHTDYDSAGRIARITATRNSGAPVTVSDVSYCHSPYQAGQACPTASASTDTDLRQWQRDNTTGAITTYSYDGAGHLTGAGNFGGATYTYAYDANGNRTSASNGSTTQALSFDQGNQITTAGYSYDANGNRTSDPTRSYTYNESNQTTTVTAGSTSTNFGYQGPGQTERTSRTGATYQAGLLGTESAYVGTAKDFIERDPSGQPLALQLGNDSTHYYVTDHLGSITHLIDKNGAVTATYTFDPYGQTLSATGPLAARNMLRYAAGETDPVTNLTKFGLRYYDPATGAWTQQDTLNAPLDPLNANRYAYAGSNPCNYTDPTGNFSEGEGDLIGTTICSLGGLALGLAAHPVGIGVTLICIGIGIAAFYNE